MAKVASVISREQTESPWSSRNESAFETLLTSLEKQQEAHVSAEESAVKCLAMSWSGKYLVSGTEKGVVKLWSLPTLSEVGSYSHENKCFVRCVVISPNDQFVISGADDSTVKVWSVASKTEVPALGYKHQERVTCVSISPNGRYMASGSRDTTVKLWNITHWSDLSTYEPTEAEMTYNHAKYVECLAISNTYLVSGGDDGTVKIWSLQDKKEKQGYNHNDFVWRVLISANDKYVVSGASDYLVKVWDLVTMSEVFSYRQERIINCLALSQNGDFMASGDSSGTVEVWSLGDMKEIGSYQHNKQSVRCVSATQEYVFSGATDKTVKVWSRQEKKILASFDHKEFVWCLAIPPNEKYFLSAAEDLKLWNLQESREIASYKHERLVKCVSISANEKYIVSGAADGTVKVWSLEDMSEVTSYKHDGELWCVAISTNAEFVVSGAQDNCVKMCHLLNPQEESLYEHTGYVRCIAISKDEDYIVSGGEDGAVHIWNVGTKAIYDEYEHSGGVLCLAISPDGKYIVSGSKDKTVQLWSFIGKTSTELYSHTGIVRCLAISNKYVASGAEDFVVKVWTIEGKESGSYTHHGHVWSLSITGDEQFVVSGAKDNTVKMWSIQKSKEIASYTHSDIVNCLSLHQQYVASGSRDKTLKLWSLEDMALQVEFPLPDSCFCLALSGKYAVCGAGPEIMILNVQFSIPGLRQTFSGPARNPLFVSGNYALDLRAGTEISLQQAKQPILPQWVNSLHISAFTSHYDKLRFYLNNGVPIIRGAFGSPLTVAMGRKDEKCMLVILEHLIEQVKETPFVFSLFHEVTEDLPELLRCNLPVIVPLLQCLFKRMESNVPRYMKPLKSLPIMMFGPYQYVELSNFQSNNKYKDDEIVYFYVSLIKWNFISGSEKSLDLLRALEQCEDRHVLTTMLVSTLIESKWRTQLPMIIGETLLYVCMLVCLILLLFKSEDMTALGSTFIVLNSVFLLYEVVQCFATGWKIHFSSVWNYIDLVRGVTSVVWTGMMLGGVEEQYLRLVVVCFCFFRGFTYFRSLKITRMFVRMITEVVKNMWAFLVILAYTTLSFGMMFSVLDSSLTNVANAWYSTYFLLVGGFVPADVGVVYDLCYILASLINFIVLFNLLIAVLVDTHDKAMNLAAENDLYEMLRVVIEYESLMFWRWRVVKSEAIIKCVKSNAKSKGTEEENGEGKTLEKRIKGIEMQLEGVNEKLKILLDRHSI